MTGSGLRVNRSKEVEPQPIKIYWLLDELAKRKIPQKPFAERLGISVGVLTGRVGVFPANKVEECLALLESWVPAQIHPGGRKGDNHPWHGSALGKRS